LESTYKKSGEEDYQVSGNDFGSKLEMTVTGLLFSIGLENSDAVLVDF
jgi:hypothetical protein